MQMENMKAMTISEVKKFFSDLESSSANTKKNEDEVVANCMVQFIFYTNQGNVMIGKSDKKKVYPNRNYFEPMVDISPEFFKMLCEKLRGTNKGKGLIDWETSKVEFSNIFNPKVGAKARVNWIKPYPKSKMLYFIFLLNERHKIIKPDFLYERIRRCFLLDGNKIDQDTKEVDVLKSMYNKVKKAGTLNKVDSTRIERIIIDSIQLESNDLKKVILHTKK